MAYKKSKHRDTRDKRSDSLKGKKFNKVAGTNLKTLQDKVDWTNVQMAALLGVGTSSYDRMVSGEIAISPEKLSILYYNLNADLHRLIGNDNNYDVLRHGEDNEFDFSTAISDIIMDIQNTDSYDERAEKILYMYSEFGKMIAYLMRPEGRDKK